MRCVSPRLWDDDPVIGTINEGPLHAAIKRWYARPGDLVEHPVDGYVIDLVREDLLIEIQTGGMAPLRDKLEDLTREHSVRVVIPIPETRMIVRMSDEGEIISRRRSPKHGSFLDLFTKLVSWPAMLLLDGFELDLLLTVEDEVRVHRPGQARRRRGWVVHSRSLVDVLDTKSVSSAKDLAWFLPDGMSGDFTTADVAEALKISRRVAQQMLYCLRHTGMVQITGKEGNALVYQRS